LEIFVEKVNLRIPMTEILFTLVATIAVFSIFLMVYFIKDRSDSDHGQNLACARCDCHRGQQPHDRPLKHPKQIEKEVRPCLTGGLFK
jgi:hypothetical protein